MFALGTLVVVAFAMYTLNVIRVLRQDAQRVANLYAEKILPSALGGDPNFTPPELNILFDIIQEMPVAVIVTDQNGIPRQWKGIPVPDTARSTEALHEVSQIAEDMDRWNPPRHVDMPLPSGRTLRWTIHVAESSFLRRVAFMPIVAAIVTLLFTFVALWGFRQIKSGEQQALWVGMAKETAHQLGTPLSSLSGWLEILEDDVRAEEGGRRRSDTYVSEMSHDIERLRKIAQRFGQIGSPPELHPELVTSVIDETVNYFHARVPRLGHDVTIERNYRADEEVPLNRELLGWAFENLLKNSLDAVSRNQNGPSIAITTERLDKWLRVCFRDNGKGLAPKDVAKVFNPGFSTKKRGWGLGMTFVKRIIEDYHGGSVNAHSPGPGQGMTIDIRLPVRR